MQLKEMEEWGTPCTWDNAEMEEWGIEAEDLPEWGNAGFEEWDWPEELTEWDNAEMEEWDFEADSWDFPEDPLWRRPDVP